MKEYPKLYGYNPNLHSKKPFIAFYKYDGSNLRFEYSRKRKMWYKFGTRHRLFDENDATYGAAIPVFLEKYGDGLAREFHDNKAWRGSDYMIAFAEYFGPNSFAGQHVDEDPKDVVLFDVDVHRRGILGPEEFIVRFGHMPIAQIVSHGRSLNEYLIHSIREGKFGLEEGVICKGGEGHDLWMCKIKTNKYKEKLQQKYLDKWTDFWE
jgi:hypothetical protein